MTFEKELKWVGYEYDTDKKDSVEVTRTKVATFKELNRTDKLQHKLHFKIISMFEGGGKDAKENEVGLNSDVLYDITVKSVNTLVELNEEFTQRDKEEFLQDSMALLTFGLWLFGNHFAPFFQKLTLD
jgi:hypothetical protein